MKTDTPSDGASAAAAAAARAIELVDLYAAGGTLPAEAAKPIVEPLNPTAAAIAFAVFAQQGDRGLCDRARRWFLANAHFNVVLDDGSPLRRKDRDWAARVAGELARVAVRRTRRRQLSENVAVDQCDVQAFDALEADGVLITMRIGGLAL